MRWLREWRRRRQVREVTSEPRTFNDLIYSRMTALGHRPSGLADAFGGYLCACEQDSWLQLEHFGPLGGCWTGWVAARSALRHEHKWREDTNVCRHGDVLCDRYGCPDDPNWKGDRR